jgi:hypothetical protein
MTATAHLQSARQLIARHGEAAWLLVDPRASAPQVTGPAIYICDTSGRTLVLLTAAGALERLSAQAALDETAYLHIKAATGVLLDDLFSSDRIHPDTRRGVILGAAFCITETRGFHITKHHGNDVQHLLLRYPDAAGKQTVLVPMPLFKTHPIAALELNAVATHVLLSEQLNYSERFAGDKPLSFVETRRNVLAGKG